MTVFDYSVYNHQYNYMERVLQQIRTYPQMNLGVVSGSSKELVPGTLRFSDVMRQMQYASTEIQAGDLDAVFEEAAQRYDVPVNLLKAVGKAESNFDPYAQSAAGAQGVMQLMPETAGSLGVTNPFDARSNIMGGAKCLADNLRRYDGDIDLTLAAYNAGSGNVAKYGGVPPFAETQNYIKKVKEYMGMTLEAGQVPQAVSGSGRIADAYCPVCGSSQETQLLNWLPELLKAQMQSRLLSLGQDYTGGLL